MKNKNAIKRNLRLEEEIMRTISEALSGLLHTTPPDELLRQITITRVSLSLDRSNAKVYFSSYLAGISESEAKKLLEENGYWIRKILSSKLRSIKTPKLQFEYDPEIDRTSQLGALFEQIRSENSEQ